MLACLPGFQFGQSSPDPSIASHWSSLEPLKWSQAAWVSRDCDIGDPNREESEQDETNLKLALFLACWLAFWVVSLGEGALIIPLQLADGHWKL